MASARPEPSRDGPVRWLASLLVPQPESKMAGDESSSRLARTIAAAPSPRLKPMRALSNGRQPSGSSDFSELKPGQDKLRNQIHAGDENGVGQIRAG
jgi:hypothetical protein